MTNDYSAFQRSAPTTEQLSQLTALILNMREAELELAKREEEQKLATERLRKVAEVDIPELMASVGLQRFTTSDGFEVRVKKHYSAAPKVADRDAAYDWLEQNGHGGLVKRTVEVGFGVGQSEDAARLVAELEGRFNNVAKARKVEPASLKAWAKRQIEDGIQFPRDLFGVRIFDRAEVKTSK